MLILCLVLYQKFPQAEIAPKVAPTSFGFHLKIKPLLKLHPKFHCSRKSLMTRVYGSKMFSPYCLPIMVGSSATFPLLKMITRETWKLICFSVIPMPHIKGCILKKIIPCSEILFLKAVLLTILHKKQ